jgi:hypothetical protein
MKKKMTDVFADLGKPTMKSIEISIQIVGGNGSRWSVPQGFPLFALLHLQVSHLTTKVEMSCFIPSPKNECLTCS